MTLKDTTIWMITVTEKTIEELRAEYTAADRRTKEPPDRKECRARIGSARSPGAA